MKRLFYGMCMGFGIGVLLTSVLKDDGKQTRTEQPIADKVLAPADPPVFREILVPPSNGWRLIEVWTRTYEIFEICPPPAALPPPIEPLVWDFTVLPPAFPR